MSKASKLRYLNEIEEKNQPTVEPAEDVQEAIPAALSEGIGGCLKEATILVVFEHYGIYLIRDKEMSVTDVIKQIEEKISIVYERGDVGVSAIKHIKEYLESYKVDTKLRLIQKAKAEFFDHVLVEEMGELMNARNMEVNGCKDFIELQTLERKFHEAKNKIMMKYKPHVEKYRKDFMESYKNIFCEEFVDQFCN
jgi:hypothetical protein